MTLEQTLVYLFESSTPRRYTSPQGLALSFDPRAGTFRAGRIDHPPSAAELASLRRDARRAGVSLTASHAASKMHAADGRTWHFAEWKL
jgi:hypothetical protein